MPIRPYSHSYSKIHDHADNEPIDEMVYACERRSRMRLPDDIPFEEWARLIDEYWEAARKKWPEFLWSDRQAWIEQYVTPPGLEDPKWGAVWIYPNIIVAGTKSLHRSWTIHEIAHAATTYQNWYVTGHGKTWRSTYLMMLNEFYPEYGRILAEEFNAEPGLNTTPDFGRVLGTAVVVEETENEFSTV